MTFPIFRPFPLLAALLLSACATSETSRRAGPSIDLPPMATFTQVAPMPPRQSNAQIGRDFLDLAFRLENGGRLPVFSRFEGPIKVQVRGPAPATLDPDLDRLLARFRKEAGLDIQRARPGQPGNIVVEAVTRAQIQRVAPSAACFVRPNVASWDEYRARRNDPGTFWTQLTERRQMAIFLPRDVSPQEVRDCLHEEIAQALGPVNDLYRLNDSIFNDDNFHTVLTGYDMLILRAHYDPALATGMSEAEVARQLPAILARLNPAGGRRGLARRIQPATAWMEAINQATMPRANRARRRLAAERAVNLARSSGSSDRLALSFYWLGRLSVTTNPDTAVNAFLAAGQIYDRRPDTAIQAAHVGLQLAAFNLSSGRSDTAIEIVDRHIPVTRRSEHAALLSLFLLVKTEGLRLKGETRTADRTEREALGWARYGFGSDSEVRSRAAEIMAISPRNRSAGGPA